MRKGQKLTNYINAQGYPDSWVQRYLFNMDDEEFDKVMNMSDNEVANLFGDNGIKDPEKKKLFEKRYKLEIDFLESV